MPWRRRNTGLRCVITDVFVWEDKKWCRGKFISPNEQNESEPQNIQLVQFGQVETPNVDMSVNPFVETAAETGAKNSTTGKSNGNYRNLPAIPAVYPTAQPRPVLPLPSIPRSAPQQQAVAVSASAQASAGEAAPKENKEAQIAFLGGGDIMFAHGMDNGN